MENILEITTREQLRNWLEVCSSTEKCCWVIVSIKQKPDTLLYLDVVEEALGVVRLPGRGPVNMKIGMTRESTPAKHTDFRLL